MNKKAVDTNVLIYLYDLLNKEKRSKSENVVANAPFVSSQVMSEFINVTKRNLNHLSKEVVLEKCIEVFTQCNIISVELKHLKLAYSFIQQYKFQIFDAIVVAAAFDAGCTILYSEDMHHGLVIEKQLTIINPYV